jgi:CBS domain-containing protein
MQIQGIPAGGFKTVGQLVGTNDLCFQIDQNAEEIAAELLSTHTSGAPVIDGAGKLVGFISEIDVLRAYESKKDLSKLTAEEIMTRQPVVVHESTPIAEAVKIMRENHWLNLPVEKDGMVKYSVTRHDLLRAYTGLGLGSDR